MKSIRVFAPATVGNVACGFDILGLAINRPGDELIMELNTKSKVLLHSITGDEGKLPLDPAKNTSGVAAFAMLKKLKSKQGITIRLNKKMPLGSGLGSSAASAAAAVFALNELFGRPFPTEQLIPFAMEGERIACGSAHADNVAPSLLGGIVLIRSNDPLEVISLPVPQKLYVVVVHPHVVLMTRDSRNVVKKEVPIKTVVAQMGHTAAFIAALYANDYGLISRSTLDFLAEPYRAALIPSFHVVKKNSMKQGALACSISGSGPSVFALCDSKETAEKVGRAMIAGFARAHIASDLFISKINKQGVKITG